MAESIEQFLTRHKLQHLTSRFQDEDIKITDFPYLRKHSRLVEILLPRIRDQIDFSKALDGMTNKCQATQVTFDNPIIPRMVSSFHVNIENTM